MFSARTFHPLTIDEIEHAATLFKDDLTRRCKQLVRRGDHVAALSTIHAEEYIDQFVSTLRTTAGSQLCQAAKAEAAARPPRARAIRLPGKASRPGLKPPIRVDSEPCKDESVDQEQVRHAREVAAATRCMGHAKHY